MISITDAAEVLGVSRQTMMAWLHGGKFPNAVKDGGWLIPVDDVEKVRKDLIADLEAQINRIAKPANAYKFNFVVQMG